MNKVLLLVMLSYWVCSSLFVMYWHHRRNELNMMTILGAILLGPILIFLIRGHHNELKKHRNILEDNNRRMDESYRRWFQLNGTIRNERTLQRGFHSLPPPPPISRREENNIKTFKFFRN